MPYKVLVCGGRDFNDNILVRETLGRLLEKFPTDLVIIHGAAAGADTLAGWWAREHSVQCHEFPADWKTFGKSAGFRRNLEMLDECPNLVVAFPGGAGTEHTIVVARKRKIPVIALRKAN